MTDVGGMLIVLAFVIMFCTWIVDGTLTRIARALERKK